MAANDSQLRARLKPSPLEKGPLRVRIEDPQPTPRRRLQEQRERILKFQRRWERISTDLPPQLSRKHSESLLLAYVLAHVAKEGRVLTVGMISIGTRGHFDGDVITYRESCRGCDWHWTLRWVCCKFSSRPFAS